MDKKTFLSELRQSLSMLQEEELQDIISEYEQHIDMKVKSGLTEEQAIEDFGSLTELAAEILEAYHVRADYAKEGMSARIEKETGRKKKPRIFGKMFNFAKNCAMGVVLCLFGVFKWGKQQISRPFIWARDTWRRKAAASEKSKAEKKRIGAEPAKKNWLHKIGKWAGTVWHMAVAVLLGCIRMGWNICCVGTSLLIGMPGAGFMPVFCSRIWPYLNLAFTWEDFRSK